MKAKKRTEKWLAIRASQRAPKPSAGCFDPKTRNERRRGLVQREQARKL